MKIKLVKKKKVIEAPAQPTEVFRLHETKYWQDCLVFIASCRSLQYVDELRGYVTEEFKKVFPEKAVPEDKPIKLITLAIAYELMVRGYKQANLVPSDKIKRNHKAAINYRPDDFDSTMQQIVTREINLKGENTMKTKKVIIKKKVKAERVTKEKKVTLAQRYSEIFESGKKLTDKEIVALINKEFGKDQAVERVAVYRSLYNAGKLAGQKNKPKTPSQSFDK